MPLINRVLHLAAGGGDLPIYTGQYVIYGDEKKGWIEMLTSGVLTMPRALRRRGTDMYLLGAGDRGNSGDKVGGENSAASGGTGGKGGKYIEIFAVDLTGSHDVTIGESALIGTTNTNTLLSDYTSANGESTSNGGKGCSIKNKTTQTAPGSGNPGRQPFADDNPLSDGLASQKLGASGGGGGAVHVSGNYGGSSNHTTICSGANGGEYGGGRGGTQSGGGPGTANTGGGGGGGNALTHTGQGDGSTLGGAGGSGIAIVRWGY